MRKWENNKNIEETFKKDNWVNVIVNWWVVKCEKLCTSDTYLYF